MKKRSYISKEFLINITCVFIVLLGAIIITKELVDYKSYKMNEILRCLSESSLQYVHEGAGVDHWQTIAESEALGTGDCEDMALLLYTKLKSNGYDPDICVGIGEMTGNEMHMWVELEFNDVGYVLDPTCHAIFQKRVPDKYIKFPNYIFESKFAEWRYRNNE